MSIGETVTGSLRHDTPDLPLTIGGRIARLLGRCGLAGPRAQSFAGIETLENRIMLADDHPNFGQVFPNVIIAPVNISLNANGQGSANGVIDYIQDNDIFTFTAPSNDFVTIWADTINELTGVSVLDSMVQVFTKNANGSANLIGSGKDSDTLTGGFNDDGWFGFKAVAGTVYYVRVMADSPPVPTMPTGVGAYVIRVDAQTTPITVNPISGEPAGPISGSLTLVGSDTVYKFTAGMSGNFNSLFTFGDQSNPTDLDGRLDIYDTNGVRVAFDSEAGRLNNAYTTVRGKPGAVYYIRFRSDSFSTTDPTSVGNFQFTIDASATRVALDTVTRRGNWFDFAGGNTHRLLDFISLGSGRTIITVFGAGLPPLVDPAVHLYNDAGQQIAFNDEFAGLNSQIEIDLVGGQRYYIVVEGFDVPNAGGFFAQIESNHTFSQPPVTPFPWDDHENVPANFDPQQPPVFFTPEYDPVRRAFERATPLVWSDYRFYLDPAGQPIPDRGAVVDAFGWGRVYGAGDSDLFQFTPPTDMIYTFPGNNDDLGTALYIGGAFLNAGNLTTTLPGPANHVVAWDANDYFPPLRGLNGTVYAMVAMDLDPTNNSQGIDPRELYVTGQFTTAGNTADPSEDIIVNNLAAWAWDPILVAYQWRAVGNGLNAPGRALAIFDPEAPLTGGPDPDPVLVIGGEFTNPGSRLAIYDGATLSAGPAVNGPVYALAVFDAPDADPQNPPEDPILALAIGGQFTQVGPTTANNIALWDFATVSRLGSVAENGVNGIVRALTAFDPPDPDGQGPAPNPPMELIIGGEFTIADDQRPGTIVANRIIRYGDIPDTGNALVFAPMGAGISGGTTPVVYALHVWDATTVGGTNPPPVVVIGGSFTAPGKNIATWDGGAFDQLEMGLNGTVRALTSLADVGPEVGYAGPVLYAAGDFTTFDYDAGGQTATGPATRVAEFDWNALAGAFLWGGGITNAQGLRTGGMETGLDATVYALAEFDDSDPNQWDRHERPATRLDIVCSPEGGYLNTFIRVYDSNFNLLYTNETIAPPFPDPSGMIDPSIAGPVELGELEGIPVWGGEVYYLEVVSSGGGSLGRYNLRVTADAFVEDNINSQQAEEADAGDWEAAQELLLQLASGDVVNNSPPTANPLAGQQGQALQNIIPVSGVSELGNLHHISDTDLFFFRAPSDGTAEIRIDTTFLFDQFQEAINGVLLTPQRRTGGLNSHLDAVIRVFNNDFEEIARSDNYAGVDGEYTIQSVGTFASRVFHRRDPAVTIDVNQDERYFVLVECAALQDYLAFNYGEIDWRAVMGGYELMVNTMPNLNFADDHVNTNAGLATMVFINQDQSSSQNGQGFVIGEIDDNASNPLDVDLFSFISTQNAVATIRLTATISSLRGFLRVFDDNLILISSAAAPAPGEEIELQLSTQPGERYYIQIAGTDLNNPIVRTEGTYEVTIQGLNYEDDHGSPHLWSSATDIAQQLYDFDGFEQLAGSIEAAGDVDIFRFTTLATDLVTITIDGLGQFDPFVRVYEVSDDPLGNAVFLQIAFNDDITPATNRDSRVTFPTTAPDRVSSLSGLTLNYYYIVVSGFDPENTRGDYTLTLQTIPSDDHPDQGQWAFATDLPINGELGQGSGLGVIERVGDTDLLSFVAPALGTGIVTITSPISSKLRLNVRLFDQNFNPIVDELTGQTILLGGDQPNASVTFQFQVERDTVYYILVQGGPLNPAFVNKTQSIGAYSIGITTPTADDHPNENEWNIATNVPLSIVTGDGSEVGIIGINTDTDLFQVWAIADGDLRISIDTPSSAIRPVLRLFNADFSEIGDPVVDGGPGDEDGLLNGSVVRTIQNAVIDDQFFFLVQSDPTALFTTGSYTVTIRGNDPPHFPPDDHADDGEFQDASVISLEPLNGDASALGGIQFDGDTDLFTFLSHGKGRTYVQVVAPMGQGLDLGVRIFNENEEEIAFDLNGIPGVEANVSFEVTGANQRYFILVTTANAAGTGDYTVRLDSAPEVYHLFYPEGFASPLIREFVAIVNPNDEAVTYTIRLRYENPSLGEVIVVQNEVLGAGQRGGHTISNGTSTPLHGLVFNEPYAIIIESDASMGASLSHYDFGRTIGENFTERVSTFWSFPRGERFPGAVNDFLLFYNPNPTRAVVVLTAFRSDGTTVSFTQVVDPFKRSGWAFNQLTALPPGSFAFTVTSAPENTGETHLGIVAALSHYDRNNNAGDAVLGDPDGGSTKAVIPGITQGPTSFAQVTIFNPGDSTAQVIMRTEYIGSVLPGFTRTINLAPRSSTTIEGAALGLAANQTAGITFTSDQKISVLGRERKQGDGNATIAYTEAGTRWFFGDAFINVARAGIQYFENLYFYNPDTAGVTAEVKILFVDGTEAITNVFIGGQGFTRLRLHELGEILDRGGLQFFALDISAARPISVTMDHYDLFLQGGWSSKGAAVGLTVPLNTI